ncbi:VOC family protein [Rhodopseudomonas boonkerdii]|uniref:VOC family protein n=1 Tax=Rhodopseudomonas boonkerdii TaxID=475937 RepID=UPI001E29431F|nr:VOC family protein [Rhodopseudomonas boonkerdii]
MTSSDRPKPVPRLTAVTLGTHDIRRSIAFYEALGFQRKAKETGEAIAFFDTGASLLALFPWDRLADDAQLPDQPRPQAFRGTTMGWNCHSREEVDAVLTLAVACGATLIKPAHETFYGGYSGYFADPDGHAWDVVTAPGIEVGDDRRVHLAD